LLIVIGSDIEMEMARNIQKAKKMKRGENRDRRRKIKIYSREIKKCTIEWKISRRLQRDVVYLG
jgi:hypothetical protein